LARVCGEDAGGHVHWGATTQNILETGDNLLLRRAHAIILGQLADLLDALAKLSHDHAATPMAGRTHGQHAVPITFGYKIAVWIDELCRHVERLQALEHRVFVAMLGGAAGTFASLGPEGPAVQDGMAALLGLKPTPIPSRTHRDREAEYVCALALLATTGGKIGNEVYTLMKQEFAEASEPVPPGTVGSSTMPQKRNPILCQDIVASAAQVRALVPLALEAMMTEHEANRTTTVMMRAAIGPAAIHCGDILGRLVEIARGITVDPARMLKNLDLTDGMILSEAIMMELGREFGRQEAHDLVYDAVEHVLAGRKTFTEALEADPRIKARLSPQSIAGLSTPGTHTGLCAEMARNSAKLAHQTANTLRRHLHAHQSQVTNFGASPGTGLP
ncbi:MAG TPA: adenylosuccinate lyase family protein, partial [Hyphomicrobiaceae bacterium]|nr:adenylosuccinate lyase family protein [Hyphomicrobiaceae bacterium]